jgi:hypothetical protein
MKQSELRNIIKEEISKALDQKWQVTFYDDYTETPVIQKKKLKNGLMDWNMIIKIL